MTLQFPYLDQPIIGDACDFLCKLPNDSVDITVTSPPYNKRRNTYGWLVQTNRYSHYNDAIPETEYQQKQVEVLNEIYRVTKPGGSLFYNHKIRWLHGQLIHPIFWLASTDWTLRQEIVWDRALAANVRGWRFWQIDERIYWLHKPVDGKIVGQELESRHAKMSSIWRIKPAPRNDNHPAPFPLELPVRAIYSMPGEHKKVVLDPYCGIGTTLVAAKLLGHHYLGVDVSPDYIALAQERLEHSESERQSVEDEIQKHKVNDPFQERKRRGTVNWPFAPSNVKAEKAVKPTLFDTLDNSEDKY